MTPKARVFWPLLLILFVSDCSTKELAVDRLAPAPETHPVIDPFVRLTLVHNPGTAFGFDLRPYLGEFTRPLLILAVAAILFILLRLYQSAAPQARLMAAGLGLAVGGAIGNLVDRFRYPLGVVDFIDVGIGSHRFWTFNLADAGITLGALVIAALLIREDEVRPSASH